MATLQDNKLELLHCYKFQPHHLYALINMANILEFNSIISFDTGYVNILFIYLIPTMTFVRLQFNDYKNQIYVSPIHKCMFNTCTTEFHKNLNQEIKKALDVLNYYLESHPHYNSYTKETLIYTLEHSKQYYYPVTKKDINETLSKTEYECIKQYIFNQNKL